MIARNLLLAAAPFILILACSAPTPIPADARIDGCYGIAGRPLFSLANGQIRRATDGTVMASYRRTGDEAGTSLRFAPGLKFLSRAEQVVVAQSEKPSIYLPISAVGDRIRVIVPLDPDFGVAEASRISIAPC